MNQIIFVTISMTGGGSERVIATLANFYVSNGYGVSIYMIGGSEVVYALDERISVNQLTKPTGGSLAGRLNRIKVLRDNIKKFKNPYVIAMGSVAAMFTSLSTIGLKCKLILSERNDPNRLNHRPIKEYEKFVRNILYLHADKVVFQTPMARDCFPKVIKRKSDIILNPISDDMPFYTSDNIREKKIIFAGRITEQKNPILLLDAFREFSKDNKEYILEYYGEGDLKEKISRLIEKYGLNDRVKINDYTISLYDIFRTADIYVSCSEWEGISNSLIEAVAMGMKVIATDCPMGGSRIILDSISYGELICMNSSCDLVMALRRCAESKKKVGREEVAAFREKLKIEKIAEKWLE